MLDDFRQMKYGNEEKGAAIDKIKKKYGFSDDANNFLEEVGEQCFLRVGKPIWCTKRGWGRGGSVNMQRTTF